jgi:hypothetical protein
MVNIHMPIMAEEITRIITTGMIREEPTTNITTIRTITNSNNITIRTSISRSKILTPNTNTKRRNPSRKMDKWVKNRKLKRKEIKLILGR